MSRIKELFQKKQKNILNVYCTAGFPKLDSTIDVIEALQENGADLIEIGMPYSDPLADGEVIQQSSSVALQNGMNIKTLFEQLAQVETNAPIILMGYMNPVLQYGFTKFCATAAEVGVDALILPDLPIYEYENEFGPIIKAFGLDFIFLVTPDTSEERIRKIDSLSTGFIYAVSSTATTGHTKDISQQESYFQRLQDMQLQNPVLVGFGIKDRSTFEAACRYTNGAIIGSAYINALSKAGDVKEETIKFLGKIFEP
ncbi:tryptophan synthase subunit alpha [Aridibaculum aurantiacum]|uniref:tryptophan synthase subunit alpha n=1 Tax=Aridibaculum aurantiacum TaxID=2810307 RepID=UPI001A958B88|nr:tryptophan synthase subunit alpha [Aridibaculum aurantiacum]